MIRNYHPRRNENNIHYEIIKMRFVFIILYIITSLAPSIFVLIEDQKKKITSYRMIYYKIIKLELLILIR